MSGVSPRWRPAASQPPNHVIQTVLSRGDAAFNQCCGGDLLELVPLIQYQRVKFWYLSCLGVTEPQCCRMTPRYSALVLASISARSSGSDCSPARRFLPSFIETIQLIFHKKLIVCLWINNHFNYRGRWCQTFHLIHDGTPPPSHITPSNSFFSL